VRLSDLQVGDLVIEGFEEDFLKYLVISVDPLKKQTVRFDIMVLSFSADGHMGSTVDHKLGPVSVAWSDYAYATGTPAGYRIKIIRQGEVIFERM